MTVGRAILRGIKLAAYGFAGLLVCVVAYEMMSLSPGTPGTADAVDSEMAVESPAGRPMVPPPPPLLGAKSSTPFSPRRIAAVQAPVIGPEVEHIRAGEPREEPGGVTEIAASAKVDAPVAPVAAVEAPVGIVIVRPPVRAPQQNRGLRWIKAVGRALRFGDKDLTAP